MGAVVVEVALKLGQEVVDITDRLAHGALGKMRAAVLEVAQGAANAFEDKPVVAGAEGLAEAGKVADLRDR